MAHVTYQIVQHDDGWAYKVNGVFSEPFPTHAEALAAAKAAAEEQRVPGQTEVIEYEDENGKWHTETASGRDRPKTDVKDSASHAGSCRIVESCEAVLRAVSAIRRKCSTGSDDAIIA